MAVAGAARGKIKLTGEQWVAVWLAGGVFSLMLITIVAVFGVYWASLPSHLNVPQQLDAKNAESFRLAVEQYTAIANAAQERAMKTFETCIAAALLPLFAGIVGYIFGREHP